MATGSTAVYLLPYPIQTDGVDVSSDVESLAVAIDNTLQTKSNIASPVFTGVPQAPTPSVNTSTSQIATTSFVTGQAASNTSPMNGIASVGTSLRYAREDHVHPTDTSRSPLSGSSSINTVGTVVSGTWNASTVGVTYGGTGISSYTTGDILYASSPTVISKLSGAATGNALISGGVGSAPSWSKIGLSTHVSGTLPVANGGTGSTTSTGTDGSAVVLAISPSISTPTISGGIISDATSINVTGSQDLAAYKVRNIYVSTTVPATGNDGDIWLKY